MSVVLALAAFAAPLAADQKETLPRPDLTGAWTLNREASTGPRSGADPGDRLGAPPGGPGGRRGMGGGFGGPGTGRGRDSVADREELARRRALMKEVLEAPGRFQITLEDPLVIFTYSDGRVVRYRTDWKEERHQYTSGTVKTKAKWDTGRLLIETNIGEGARITHAYKLEGDPRQLVVQVQLPDQSRDLPAITHVYDEVMLGERE